MFAIVTVLSGPSETLVRAFWRELETDCGLTGYDLFTIPHFSWQGADTYDIPAVEKTLGQIASSLTPMQVTAGGLGIFSGPRPVIYIPLAKNMQLTRLHQTIWRKMKRFSQGLNHYYSPQLWMPHITLGLMNMDNHDLVCAVDKLGSRQIEFTFTVDNLALVSQEGDRVGGLISRFILKGG